MIRIIEKRTLTLHLRSRVAEEIRENCVIPLPEVEGCGGKEITIEIKR